MKPPVSIQLKKSDFRSRLPFLVSTVLAVAIVVVGWVVTVASGIKQQVASVSQSVNATANEARAQFQRTRKDAEPITEQFDTAKSQLSEQFHTLKELDETKSFLVEHMKQQILEDQSNVTTP